MGNSSSNIKTLYFDELFKTLPSMKGKRVVITGTTTGIGNVAAHAMAKLGATVIVMNRKSQRSKESFLQLQSENPDSDLYEINCDLQSFASVKAATAEYKKLFGGKGLDVLANNAGIMAVDDVATTDGFDVQMQTNHLSHYIITAELLPELELAAQLRGESRIVNQSSGNRKRPSKDLMPQYFQKRGGKLGGNSTKARYQRYQQSKLANAVFSYALHDMLTAAGSSTKAITCHPGITATNLQSTSAKSGGKLMLKLLSKIAQSPKDGAQHLVQSMCGLNVKSGDFWGPNGNSIKGPTKSFTPESLCTNPSSKKLIITESAAATGIELRVGAPFAQ